MGYRVSPVKIRLPPAMERAVSMRIAKGAANPAAAVAARMVCEIIA